LSGFAVVGSTSCVEICNDATVATMRFLDLT
jgi:hypothetical protein